MAFSYQICHQSSLSIEFGYDGAIPWPYHNISLYQTPDLPPLMSYTASREVSGPRLSTTWPSLVTAQQTGRTNTAGFPYRRLHQRLTSSSILPGSFDRINAAKLNGTTVGLTGPASKVVPLPG